MTVKYNIEKNIPQPKERRGRASEFPFAQMDLGDSFLAPDSNLRAMQQNGYHWGKKLGRKFTSAKVEGGVRVWRVA
jgi:hypothetical protein